MPKLPERQWGLIADGQNFQHWSWIKFRRAIDSADTVTFGAPFDHENPFHRELFRPSTFKPVVLQFGGKPIFTGTGISPSPSQSSSQNTATLSARSLSAIWEDCPMPPTVRPLEKLKQNLLLLAGWAGLPYALTPEFRTQPGPIFDKVAIGPSEKVLPWMAGLAKQRGMVIGANALGMPLFWKSEVAGPPVAQLDAEKNPVTGVEFSIDERQIFSDFTGIAKAKRGRPGSQFTAFNSKIAALRPDVFELDDTEPAAVPAAANARLGRSAAQAYSWKVQLSTIYDQTLLNLFDRNTFVTLKAPRVFVYSTTLLLIRAVEFDIRPDSQTCELELVLPRSFAGLPEVNLPWEEKGLS